MACSLPATVADARALRISGIMSIEELRTADANDSIDWVALADHAHISRVRNQLPRWKNPLAPDACAPARAPAADDGTLVERPSFSGLSA